MTQIIRSKRLTNTTRELRLVDYGWEQSPRYEITDVDVITETNDSDGVPYAERHEAEMAFEMTWRNHELEQEEGQ